MNRERLLKVLLAPHVSEKSTLRAANDQQHVFRVLTNATKLEIKQAVEMMFEVKVTSVQTLNQVGKSKRFANRQGSRSDTKKAYVTLASGYDIDFLRSE